MNPSMTAAAGFLLLVLPLSVAAAQSQGGTEVTMKNAPGAVTSVPVRMTIDPSMGGRIVSFTLDGFEFLTGTNIHPDNFGSTFWPSPQSMWNWPPPPALDNKPYESMQKGPGLSLVSEQDLNTGLQVQKEFRPGTKGRIQPTYTIINSGTESRKAAPWEITRANKGGLLFFPAGKTPVGKKHFDPARLEVLNGVIWYQDEKERPSGNRLSIADGSEGWTAYAIGGRVLIKKFRDVAPEDNAPGEAEVSLYVSGEADYIELQGPYREIKPGERLSWSVEWIAVETPPGLVVEKGSAELVDFVRGIVRHL